MLGNGQLVEKKTIDLKGDPRIKLLAVIGSIPKGKFIHGWSDIDLLLVADSFDLGLFETIYKLQTTLQADIGLKTGVEVISSAMLKRVAQDKQAASGFLKILKQFHQNNIFLEEGFLYKAKNYDVISLKEEFFRGISIAAYVAMVWGAMQKLLISQEMRKNRKYVLRKLVKNSLLLIQTKILVDSGKLIVDFDEVINQYKNTSADLSYLQNSFGKRFKWKGIKEEDISDLEIYKNWEILSSILDEVLKQ